MNIKLLKIKRLLNDPIKRSVFNNIIEKINIANTHDEIEFLVDNESFIIFNLETKIVFINKNLTKKYFEIDDSIFIFIYVNFYNNFKFLLSKPSVPKEFYRNKNNYEKINVKKSEILLKYL